MTKKSIHKDFFIITVGNIIGMFPEIVQHGYEMVLASDLTLERVKYCILNVIM